MKCKKKTKISKEEARAKLREISSKIGDVPTNALIWDKPPATEGDLMLSQAELETITVAEAREAEEQARLRADMDAAYTDERSAWEFLLDTNDSPYWNEQSGLDKIPKDDI